MNRIIAKMFRTI